MQLEKEEVETMTYRTRDTGWDEDEVESTLSDSISSDLIFSEPMLSDSITITGSTPTELSISLGDSVIAVSSLRDTLEEATRHAHTISDRVTERYEELVLFEHEFINLGKKLFGSSEKVESTKEYLEKLPGRIIKEFVKDFAKELLKEYENHYNKSITAIRLAGEGIVPLYTVYSVLAKFEETHVLDLKDFDEHTRNKIEVLKSYSKLESEEPSVEPIERVCEYMGGYVDSTFK